MAGYLAFAVVLGGGMLLALRWCTGAVRLLLYYGLIVLLATLALAVAKGSGEWLRYDSASNLFDKVLGWQHGALFAVLLGLAGIFLVAAWFLRTEPEREPKSPTVRVPVRLLVTLPTLAVLAVGTVAYCTPLDDARPSLSIGTVTKVDEHFFSVQRDHRTGIGSYSTTVPGWIDREDVHRGGPVGCLVPGARVELAVVDILDERNAVTRLLVSVRCLEQP
ncbi:hypothetical protein D5S17_29520 [Pseudonocardiaceae bacterium YIM PH 21723]|nr:hypothetical protein D5S17_29520 [Pseudonocardiaceae bacterium YIM PH 21723]